VHGLKRGIFWTRPFLDVTLGGFDHDDRIIHHQSIARTKPKSESVLMEKPKIGKNAKSSDKRYRHCQQRDQRRPPTLQKMKTTMITSVKRSRVSS